MRFSALLRKELRESLPWMVLAAIIFLGIGGLSIREAAVYGSQRWHYSNFSPGTAVETYRFTRPSVLGIAGIWLFCASVGLGLVLGVRHFLIPHFTRTWPFLLHRSVSRQTVLGAKLSAATLALVVPLGAIWIVLYWYVCQPELFLVPPSSRIFIEGWLFIVLGLVAYLGTALAGLSTARWYTTRIFGLAFATIVIFITFLQYQLGWAIAAVIVGVIILLSQVIDTFLNREF